MVKSLFKGLLFGVGFVLGIYLMSKLMLFGIGDTVKDFISKLGEMLISLVK